MPVPTNEVARVRRKRAMKPPASESVSFEELSHWHIENLEKLPRTRSEIEQHVRHQLAQLKVAVRVVAEKANADPKRTWKILSSHGYLEDDIWLLLGNEQTAKRRAEAARAVREALKKHRFPFDHTDPYNPEGNEHPLSRSVIERIVTQAETELARARAERRKLGINKSAKSVSLQKTKAIGEVAHELEEYFTQCMLTGDERRFRDEARRNPALAEGTYRATGIKHHATELASNLLSIAFPVIARGLTPQRVKGRRPKAHK